MESKEKQESIQSPVLEPDSITQFTCYAPGGMGNAFWIRVDLNKENDLTWHRSDKESSVTVWTIESMNLGDIKELKEGMEVRLNIEVKLNQIR